MKGAQLALPVQLDSAAVFETFFPGPNGEVVEALRGLSQGNDVPSIWLYGAPKSGRTHLLRAAVAAAGPSSRMLDARQSAELTDDVREVALLAIDDIEPWVSRTDTALGLLRLIDQRRAAGLPLLLSAEAPPARLTVALPDLRTRLDAMLRLGLRPLRESDRLELLRLQAAERGLDLPDDATSWLLAHLQRDAGSLIAALDRIDRAALSAKRRPTLPFVLQTLNAPPPVPGSGQTSSG